ncbi:hypothetical protein H0H87_000075 [Tephrocybe sp. NHM501043]|nr:hypothetical protein H0H87_000075 [Tephrocybe sp. NHM501043]
MAKEAENSYGKNFDVVALVLKTEAKLTQELSEWVQIYAQELSYLPLPICAYRGNTSQMYISHCFLSEQANTPIKDYIVPAFSRSGGWISTRAAREVIQIMVERLYPTGNLRFAMGANFLYVSFAAAFLINLLRPKLVHLLDEKRQAEIIQDVRNLINMLGSKDVALDSRHTPALYSRFLSSLLAKHNCAPPEIISGSPSTETPASHFPTDGDASTSSLAYSWPDIMYEANTLDQPHGYSASHGGPYASSDVDMDFSLSHFVRTVNQGYPLSESPDLEPVQYADLSNGSQGMIWDMQGPAAMQFANLWRV